MRDDPRVIILRVDEESVPGAVLVDVVDWDDYPTEPEASGR